MPGSLKSGAAKFSIWWIWFLLLELFSFGAAADSALGTVEIKPVGGDFSSQRFLSNAADADIEFSVKHDALSEHSFTDQFLEFLRQRSQALDAANQMAMEDAAEMEELQDVLAEDAISEGDLSVLATRAGDRRWKFFRPDPFETGRSTSFQLHVRADQSLEAIKLLLLQRWPDLRPPQI